MRILVVGASGLLGSTVLDAARSESHEALGTHNETPTADVALDKTDRERVRAVVEEFDPDAVVDVAAFHDVDRCETDRERAWSVNAAGTAAVARAAASVGAHYVFLSTDYVFSGRPGEAPYDEDDPVAPQNYYGRTKLAAEQAARIPDRWTVLRSSVLYGPDGEDFVSWALGQLRDGDELGIVDDQTAAPTYVPDLADACVAVVDREVTGLYHATGPASLSRYDFTVALADTFGFDPELVDPISTEELGQTAPRPTDSTLDSSRLYAATDVEFRPPEAALAAMRDLTD